jgi:hypothetical protein
MAKLTKQQIAFYQVLATSNILKKNLESGPYDVNTNPGGFKPASYPKTSALYPLITPTDRTTVMNAVNAVNGLAAALATSRTFFDDPYFWGDPWAEDFASRLVAMINAAP